MIFFEGGESLWLRAKNIKLGENEKVLIIFPRGNIITPGPVVFHMTLSDKPAKENCDIILTDKRFILCFGDNCISSDLNRVDSCIVSNTGKLIGNKYVLIINFIEGMFRIKLPFGAQKNKNIMNTIALYIQSVMLK